MKAPFKKSLVCKNRFHIPFRHIRHTRTRDRVVETNTVDQLINYLQRMPKNAKVFVIDIDSGNNYPLFYPKFDGDKVIFNNLWRG